jgi:DNA-binding NarL/FixJ family response regulator
VTAVKVLVVTEIRLYRDGVADALRKLPDVELVVTAADGAAAVVAARRAECDVVLVDMVLPDCTRTVRALLSARPTVKVVALGVPEDGPEVVAVAEAGISGYVSREDTVDQVGEALRSVLRGEAACSGKVTAGLLAHIALQAKVRPSAAVVAAPLTPRERDVLRLIENGMSNKEIARALDLQLSTVKNHVHNLLTKFGASGRAEVSAVAGQAWTIGR